jgi:hypothetical protein
MGGMGTEAKERKGTLHLNKEEALTILLGDRRAFLETLFEVENKDRELVPFTLNDIQSKMYEESSYRDIYVKPGQVGATTFFVADFLADNLTIDGTVSVIISYDEWVAKRQLLKVKKFYAALKRRIPTLPRLDHKAAEQLSFEDTKTGFYSDFYIHSVQSESFGRGDTIHNLLLDEFAFWKAGSHEKVMAGPVQRVPLTTRSKVRIVSTANGEGNPFHEMYVASKEGKKVGANVYKAHFYPWWIHSEYEMAEDSVFCLPGDNTYPLLGVQPDEMQLAMLLSAAGYSDEIIHRKLRWRRYKQVEVMSLRRSGESQFIFHQEYPEDDESCFCSAGDMAYSVEMISEKARQCKGPEKQVFVTDPETGTQAVVDVWCSPEKKHGYVLSIDPGKGKTSESVAHVWRFIAEDVNEKGVAIPPRHIHCATLCGYYDEDMMGRYCKELGRLYNEAVICPEDNLDLVAHVKDYPCLYYREDVTNGKVIQSIGWNSNTSTKPYMRTELSRNMQYMECYDRRFWSQCRNIRRDPESRTGLKVVGADDHHDCAAIAIVCRNVQPVERGYAGEYGWKDSWGQTK